MSHSIRLAVGVLSRQASLTVESLMPTHGVILSDGIESDFLHFNSGSIATMGIAREKAILVVNDDQGAA